MSEVPMYLKKTFHATQERVRADMLRPHLRLIFKAHRRLYRTTLGKKEEDLQETFHAAQERVRADMLRPHLKLIFKAHRL